MGPFPVGHFGGRFKGDDRPRCSMTGIDLKASEFKGKLPEGYCSVGLTAAHCLSEAKTDAIDALLEGKAVQACFGKRSSGFEVEMEKTLGKQQFKAMALFPKRQEKLGKAPDLATVLLPCDVSFKRSFPLAKEIPAFALKASAYFPVSRPNEGPVEITSQKNSSSITGYACPTEECLYDHQTSQFR